MGSRSPYGERGLKLDKQKRLKVNRKSLSLRRAWIEMTHVHSLLFRANEVALLTESVD